MKKIATVFITVFGFSGIMVGNASAENYEVKKGDSLWSISRNFDTTVNDLKEWNGISSDVIYPSQELTVSTKKTYMVKKGDTLWDIAIHNNVSVDQIKEWNHLNSETIHPKDRLVIFSNGKKVENKVVATSTSVKKDKTTAKKVRKKENSNEGKEINMTATAYTASCGGCSGVTATGVNLNENPNAKVISVDPKVIPLGTKVYVEGYGYATAADTGGAIKGNKIDIFIPSIEKAKKWGVKTVKVKVLN